MKTIVLPRIGAGLLLFFACAIQSADSQIIVSVDMDTATVGIQSIRAATPGELFTADLIMTVGPGGVSSYGISARFDTAELSLNGSPAAFEATPAGMSNFTVGVASENNALGEVNTFEAGTLGLGPASTSFSIGTINFSVPSVLNDGAFDVNLGFFNFGVDGAFDNAGGAVAPTFVSGSIVPEPSSLGLVALGSLGMLIMRRTRR